MPMKTFSFHHAFISCTLFLALSGFTTVNAQRVDQTGTFPTDLTGNFVVYAEVTFTDANANGKFDASLALSDRRITSWDDYACTVAFYTDGLQIRNSTGGFESTNTVRPVSGETLEIWLAVNTEHQTYSLSARKPGAAVIKVSDAGVFRYKATAINRWSSLHNQLGESDYVTVSKIGTVGAVGDVYEPATEPVEPFIGYTVADEGAWCWFADPRALHYENEAGTINSTWIGYIDIHGHIKATQHDFLTGKTNEVSIRTYFQPDDHNNPTFLVLPDERVMIFYSRHTDEACFYYRVSQKPGDITTLGDEKRLATANNTTYPSPFILSDDPDHIYLCWRGINWHPTIAQLSIPDENDECKFTWGPYQMVQSTGARPYAKYASNGKDKIYMTYTTAHPDNQNPNYVYFNYVDINTKKLLDINGRELSDIATAPLSVSATSTYKNNYPETVVDDANMRDWVWQVVPDADGVPVIAMVRINAAKTSHDYYYVKWTGSEWKKTFLCNAGGHFHQTPTTEKCYSGGMAIDNANPNIIYCSQPVTGAMAEVYEIVKYTLNENQEIVSTEQITKNSTYNNIRPFIIPGSENSPMRLTWMNGLYYYWIVSRDYPNAFPTTIQADWQLPADAMDLEDGLVVTETFDGEISGTAKTSGGALISTAGNYADITVGEAGGANAFTIALSPYLASAAYYGDIVTMGNLTYGLDETTQKPYVKIGDRIWNGSNRYGSSDVWKNEATGTGGNWPTPTKYEYFSLVLTYESGTLRTYVNGLIDQSIDVETLALDDVRIGGYTGYMEDCRIYDRALSQGEVKSLSAEVADYVLADEQKDWLALAGLQIPSEIYTDIVLPASVDGASVTWSSSRTDILTNTGLATLPAQPTEVVLTAAVGAASENFTVTVMPRNIAKNKWLHYDFDAADVYEQNGVTYVRDKSGHGNDLAVYGSAKVNGTLDLSANSPLDFSTNGYAMAPADLLGKLRSYTFVVRVVPTSLDKAPRLYDFGSSAWNSLFGRASVLTQGIKYNSGTTEMIDANNTLKAGEETWVAFTFDAKTKTGRVYFDGKEDASGTFSFEPYQLSELSLDKRNYIGRTQWWDTSEKNNNGDYVGEIDDFMMFDIALTENEINALRQPAALPASMISGWNVSPNPARPGQLCRMTSENLFAGCCVEIFDVFGRKIDMDTVENTGILSFRAPVSKGLYVVRVVDADGMQHVAKLLVE